MLDSVYDIDPCDPDVNQVGFLSCIPNIYHYSGCLIVAAHDGHSCYVQCTLRLDRLCKSRPVLLLRCG